MLKVDHSVCDSCATCVGVCPSDALEMSESEKLQVNYSSCIKCGICVKICPFAALTLSRGSHDDK